MNCIAIAIDSFKGSLSSKELADSVKNGILKVYKDIDIKIFLIADGGEGSLDSFLDKGDFIFLESTDPLGEKIESKYLKLSSTKAIIESAQTIALTSKTKENFLRTSSFGLGELINDALNRGFKDIIITLGGTATNDAGAGMLEALGYRFFDNQDKIISPNSSNLKNISKIDSTFTNKKAKKARFRVAVDVDAKMLGQKSCTKLFSLQKGAKRDDLELLETEIRHFCNLIKKTTSKNISNLKGAGAGGCIAGTLNAFLDAQIISGTDFILDSQNFEKEIENCDLIITGEGKIDSQTSMGKAISGVAKAAKKQDIPVMAICGEIDEEIQKIHSSLGVDAVFSIIDKPISLKDALKPETTKKMVENLTEEIFRIIKISKSKKTDNYI